jgi:hypothetical protein
VGAATGEEMHAGEATSAEDGWSSLSGGGRWDWEKEKEVRERESGP